MRALGTVIFFLLVAGVGFCLGWSAKLVVTGASATTLLQSATIVVTVALAVWTYRATKRKEAEARLFVQKAAVYEPLVEELKKLHLAGRNGNPEMNMDELAQALVDIQFKAIVWGDHEFLLTLMEMGDAQTGESLDLTFGRVARLYAQIRKELGHSDKPGVGYDVMELLLIAEDRHLVRAMKKKIHG